MDRPESLPSLIERLNSVFTRMDVPYEAILVHDASPDESWHVMKKLRAEDPRVKIIQHMRNFGQHKATLCGMVYSKGEFVVTMDDDLQHPPEEIPKLFEALNEDHDADVVINAACSSYVPHQGPLYFLSANFRRGGTIPDSPCCTSCFDVGR